MIGDPGKLRDAGLIAAGFSSPFWTEWIEPALGFLTLAGTTALIFLRAANEWRAWRQRSEKGDDDR